MFVTQTGEPISLHFVDNIYKVANAAMNKAKFYGRNPENQNEQDQPVGEWLYNEYLKMIQKHLHIDLNVNSEQEDALNEKMDQKVSFSQIRRLVDAIFLWRAKWENIEKGCSNIFDLSLKNFGTYRKFNGSQCVKLKKGYKYMLDKMLEPLRTKFDSKLKLNHCLKKILVCEKILENSEKKSDEEDQESCTHCFYTQDKNKIVLVLDDTTLKYNPTDTLIICDNVLCTMSLGYLKENVEQLFEPFSVLSKRKVRAIKQIGLDTWHKFFLHYEKPFWNHETFEALNLIWLPEQPNQTVFDMMENTLKSSWLESVISIQPVHTQKSTLIVYVCEHFDVECMDAEQIKQDITNLIKRFLKRDDIPMPNDIVRLKQGQIFLSVSDFLYFKANYIFLYRSMWHSNPFFRGTYSYLPLNSSPEDFDALAEPIVLNDNKNVGQFNNSTNQ